MTFDITSVLQGWVTTPSSNNGLQITAALAQPGTQIILDTKESTTTESSGVYRCGFDRDGKCGSNGSDGSTRSRSERARWERREQQVRAVRRGGGGCDGCGWVRGGTGVGSERGGAPPVRRGSATAGAAGATGGPAGPAGARRRLEPTDPLDRAGTAGAAGGLTGAAGDLPARRGQLVRLDPRAAPVRAPAPPAYP